MEVEKVLHMNQGVGEDSYAHNSLIQRTVQKEGLTVIEESTREMYVTLKPGCIMMADMGCSSGPNALHVVYKILDIIEEASKSSNRQCPQLGVFLIDLPGNDFNALFNFIPSLDKAIEETKGSNFRPCFVSGIPKSFYGRVFPDNFLHLVHSSSSIHWLSQVPKGLVSENGEPLNKGNICIAKTSPPEISKAYYAQFKRDFMLFLRSRSREMVCGGRMVLIFQGCYDSDDPNHISELLGSALQDTVTKGKIEQQKLDMFNLPFYAPTVTEVRQLVEADGTFIINKLETSTLDWSVDTSQSLETRAEFVAKSIRAVTESMLATAFHQAVMDDLFLQFQERVKERITEGRSEQLNIVLSVTKND